MSSVADKQWFVDQGAAVIEEVPYGDRVVRVKSLDVLEKAMITGRVAAACTVGEKLDTDRFSVENAIALLAASIVDANGTPLFTDSPEDLAIVKKLRAKIGETIEKTVQSLSFPDQENKLKN